MSKNNKITAIIVGILVITIIAVMGYIIKVQIDILGSIDNANKEQKFLQDNITRIESTILSSRDFDKKLSSLDMNMNVIRRDLNNVGGKINEIIESNSKTPGGTFTGQSSTSTAPIDDSDKPPVDPNCPDCILDRHGYFANKQILRLTEPLSGEDGIPFGSIEFNAAKEHPWAYTVYPRIYSSTFVLATDVAGNRRAYTKMSIAPEDGSGKKYDLPEVEVKYFERYPEPEFFLWNPRAMVGFDAGYSTNPDFMLMPSAQLFISSYGKTKKDTKWYIGGVGVGYDIVSDNFSLLVTPFSYKATSDTSIFQNINVGPSIGVDLHGNVYGGAGLRFGL